MAGVSAVLQLELVTGILEQVLVEPTAPRFKG